MEDFCLFSAEPMEISFTVKSVYISFPTEPPVERISKGLIFAKAIAALFLLMMLENS